MIPNEASIIFTTLDEACKNIRGDPPWEIPPIGPDSARTLYVFDQRSIESISTPAVQNDPEPLPHDRNCRPINAS